MVTNGEVVDGRMEGRCGKARCCTALCGPGLPCRGGQPGCLVAPGVGRVVVVGVGVGVGRRRSCIKTLGGGGSFADSRFRPTW
eukprot:scaffold23659_cov36-Tisochrysis_lutea.AAC.6